MSDKKKVNEDVIFPSKDDDGSLRPKPKNPPTPKPGEKTKLND